MSSKDKLIERFKGCPTDFTWKELQRLLGNFGYEEIQGNGSRVKFVNKTKNRVIALHKPHPGNILKHYIMTDVAQHLSENGLI